MHENHTDFLEKNFVITNFLTENFVTNKYRRIYNLLIKEMNKSSVEFGFFVLLLRKVSIYVTYVLNVTVHHPIHELFLEQNFCYV